MTKEEVLNRLTALVSRQKGIDYPLTTDMRLKDDLMMDSVELMMFVIAVEETFRMSINDERMDHFVTAGDVIDVILE